MSSERHVTHAMRPGRAACVVVVRRTCRAVGKGRNIPGTSLAHVLEQVAGEDAMPTRSALTLADTVADETRTRRSSPSSSSGDALGTQAAFVRALVDEVQRQHPAD